MKIVDDKNFNLAFSKRPSMQLYDVKKDRFCKSNIAEYPEYKEILTDLHNELIKRLKEQEIKSF